MRRLPPHVAALGYSPARYVPLSPAPVNGMGERLTDLMAIQRLFANGENGGYWPADPAYLFEDSAGTIPASVNGVVGLRYDVSKRLALGPNVIVNGTFDIDASWIKVGEWGIADGVATHSSATLDHLRQDVLVAGRFYRITGRYSNGTSLNVYAGPSSYALNVPTPFSVTLQAATPIAFLQTNQNGLWIDDISYREVYGNHAIQATTANKPYLRRTPVTGKYWYDSNTETGALTATFSGSLGSACTIATVGAEGVTIAENQTVGSTYNIAPYNASQLTRYRGDILIINRALTPVEKALVTRHFKRGVPMISNGAIL